MMAKNCIIYFQDHEIIFNAYNLEDAMIALDVYLTTVHEFPEFVIFHKEKTLPLTEG